MNSEALGVSGYPFTDSDAVVNPKFMWLNQDFSGLK
jgi:hypothetical protein